MPPASKLTVRLRRDPRWFAKGDRSDPGWWLTDCGRFVVCRTGPERRGRTWQIGGNSNTGQGWLDDVGLSEQRFDSCAKACAVLALVMKLHADTLQDVDPDD